MLDRSAGIDGSTEVTAGAALFTRLKALGVDYVFCNSGTDFPPIIEGLAEAAAKDVALPEAVVIPHEHAALGMAHGYYLATGAAQAVIEDPRLVAGGGGVDEVIELLVAQPGEEDFTNPRAVGFKLHAFARERRCPGGFAGDPDLVGHHAVLKNTEV